MAHYTLTLLFVFVMSLGYSQSQSLSGTIKDTENTPLIGVNILNNSSEKHTSSDENGYFVLPQASIGDTIHFSYIGYKSYTLIIDESFEQIQITLDEQSISLEEIVVLPKQNALNIVTDIDIRINPVNSSQELLRKIPGLFIGQHAGGGKAEQIFLRGFDIDHGTDISITADGMPVNMVSHAHGQGYSDLHFIIPETIDKVDFGKGSYVAEKGNFNTAGYVNFKTKSQLENNLLKVEAGQFNTKRAVGLFDIINQSNKDAYIATEYILSDGPFESPQNFNRLNIFGKYTSRMANNDKWGVIASHFTSQWDASGQVPQRAIDQGFINRFGAIDNTEGGKTSRTNLQLTYDKFINQQSFIKNTVYYSQYDFELYSNFTFFMNDPVNGDQIRQVENRQIFGGSTTYNRSFSNSTTSGLFSAGLSIRNDQITDNELSRTANREETLNAIKLGDVNEHNTALYTKVFFEVGKWNFTPAVRLDYFNFQYKDFLLQGQPTQSVNQVITSPKLAILYNQNNTLQWYLNLGKGFHSNDTRVVVAQQDKETIPAAYGYDIGVQWKPFPKLFTNIAFWQLYLEQEFVYVGDEGVVEPSGKTTRQGIDLSLRYQPKPWLFMSMDANYTHARAITPEQTETFIPLAPDVTLVGAVNAISNFGLRGGLQFRFIDDRPANEDNSIVARGYSIIDLNVGYKFKRFDFSVQIQNLFNTTWNETQFATESRLADELESVEEIHFTPGTPFFLKGVLSYSF